MKNSNESKVLLGMALWFCLEGMAYAAGPVKILKIQVDCSGDDSIGSQVCYAVKEKIRASRGFELINPDTPISGSFTLSLVSASTTVQIDSNDYSSAISEVITGIYTDGVPILLAQYIFVCGADRVDNMANQIMANLEEKTDFIRKR